MFTFLNIVESGGAGTAVLTGSHRLLNNGVAVRLQDVKSQLKREPFFRELCSRDFSERERLFRATGRVKGVDLDVVELVGEPGDVYLMDMRVLHTRCPNTSRAPRMMLTQRFLLASVRGQVRNRYFEPPQH